MFEAWRFPKFSFLSRYIFSEGTHVHGGTLSMVNVYDLCAGAETVSSRVQCPGEFPRLRVFKRRVRGVGQGGDGRNQAIRDDGNSLAAFASSRNRISVRKFDSE